MPSVMPTAPERITDRTATESETRAP